MDDESKFGSIQKSISGQSNYSSVYEDIELGSRNSNKNNSKNQELLINNFINFSHKNDSIIINKNPLPFPEDTKEENIDVLKISNFEFKNKNEIIDEINEENNIINKINNFNTINHSNNFNNINNLQKFEEDLYSIKRDSNSFSDKHSSNKMLDTFDKKNLNRRMTLIFDKTLEKSFENSNNNEHLNINNKIKKEEKQPLKRSFKRFKTLKIEEINKPLLKGIYDIKRGISCNIFATKNSKKRPYFDLKNILKKAVILNGKKGKSIKKSTNKSLNKYDKVLSNNINENLANEALPINNINFQNIQIDKININYIKKNFRRLDVESKNKKSNNNYIKTLFELQNFYIENCIIRVIKLSPDGHYLSAGCENGKIKVYEIMGYYYSNFNLNYNKDNIKEYLNFINEIPYKILVRHKKDIIDLDWSPFYPNLLLSASLDHFVCLWDLNEETKNCLIKEYNHKDVVTSVSFNPKFRNIFISGCLDTFVRIWKFNYEDNIINLLDDYNNINTNNNINEDTQNALIYSYRKKKNKEKIIETSTNENNNTFEPMHKSTENLNQTNIEPIHYFNIENKVISLAYFPDGSKIGIGTEKGKIFVYNNDFQEFNYNNNFLISKKKFGCFNSFFKSDKKITDIYFIDKTNALISSSDSYIRLVDMNSGRILYQYKGYVNNVSMTRAYADLSDDVIIVGGKDGYCYLWNLYEKLENKNYIRFKPFSKELIESSLIAHERCFTYYMQKVLKLTSKLLIRSIIVNCTSKGRLEILLNIQEPN